MFIALIATSLALNPRVQGESIAKYLRSLDRSGYLSGTVLVGKGDSVIFEHSYGMADWEHKLKNTNDTRYCVASITKWMTLIVLLRMIESHQIDINDTLEKYIPGEPNGNKITLLQLINHRSGLPHEFTNVAESSVPRSAEEMAELGKSIKPVQDPGGSEIYSSAGFTLLARVVELVRHKSFQEVLNEEVFEPSRMNETVDPAPFEVIPKRATSYMFTPRESWRCIDTDYTHLVGAGSVFSTAHDLFLMLRGIADGKYGKTVSGNLLAKPISNSTGLTNGYQSFIEYDKATDVTVVFCGNSLSGVGGQLQDHLLDVAEGKVVEPTLTAVPTPNPAVKTEDYLGDYSINGSEPTRMRLRDGYLAFSDSVLVPIAQDTFFAMRDFGTVKAVRNVDGSVQKLDWYEHGKVVISLKKVG